MKEYPSIQRAPSNVPIYAFDKLDGSNVRAEWTAKSGINKFGTRSRLLGEDEPIFGKAPEIIRTKYEKDLDKAFKKQRWRKVICFFEFYGPNSFCGWHDSKDTFDVTLFDVYVDSGGLLEPRDFIKYLGHLDIAALLYRGNANSDFIKSVRSGTLENMTFEGVVCKGKYVSPGLPLMFKIKSDAWLKRLKDRCKGDEKLFNELA